jgi:ribosomal protein S18 acetylase RimI-like enzyme
MAEDSKPAFLLRRACEADAEAICTVMTAALGSLGDPMAYLVDDLTFISEHIARRGFTLVATEDDQVVGFQIVRFPGSDPDNLGRDIGLSGPTLAQVAHLESAAVVPAHWGEGLQRLLLARAEEELSDQGFRYLMCTVYPGNLPSLRNLEAVGYRVVATKAKYGGYERHVMLKEHPQT